MIRNLRYGAGSSLRLELADNAVLASFDMPRGEPLTNVAAAVDRALAAPLSFPPLSQGALPGDHVVLALAGAVPRAATIVARTIEVLLASGVDPADITLVQAPVDVEGAPDPLDEVRDEVRGAIARETHDPAHREALGYLAASAEGEPIYINRTICDADLVISIGCLRVDESLGYHGIHSSVFPAFSDVGWIERYSSAKANEPKQRERLRAAADEVGWLLGLLFTIQVVPGGAGEVLGVLAGEFDAVAREGGRQCDLAWRIAIPEQAALVIATVEGDATQQTWDNVARALDAASRAARADGALAVCCELSGRLGPALESIVGAEDLDAALREIRRHKFSDALAAAELIRALERGKVFLLSRLDDELVEELGMVPLAPDQVSRLAARFDSCIVLADAQYALPTLSGRLCQPPQVAGRKSRS